MKYYANGFEYILVEKYENRDWYRFVRKGGYSIWRSHYELVVEGYFK